MYRDRSNVKIKRNEIDLKLTIYRKRKGELVYRLTKTDLILKRWIVLAEKFTHVWKKNKRSFCFSSERFMIIRGNEKVIKLNTVDKKIFSSAI